MTRPAYKRGDPPPSGYLAWHVWAEAQSKAGLRQKQCRKCLLWRFPQELSKRLGLLCLKCEEAVEGSVKRSE